MILRNSSRINRIIVLVAMPINPQNTNMLEFGQGLVTQQLLAF